MTCSFKDQMIAVC